ncbi:MAG: ATPase [Synergistaceae bacterium]|jgi:V/A-type H+-transporting ATPase subunit E|nr:ATPase [Synergistaceae bacterium]
MNEVENEKIVVLQKMILEHASSQKYALAEDARKEAESWLSNEITKVERETSMVLADAKRRSEDIHRRQVLAAEREKSTEGLRQQNRLLQQALKKFQDELVKLRERPDYAKILTSLALNAASRLRDSVPTKLRLAAIDSQLGEEIADAVNKKLPEALMAFDREPAPIIGGCWVMSSDGRRQINSDWQSRTQEISDTLAERLLALL